MISSARTDEKRDTSDRQEIKTTADISLVKFGGKTEQDEALVPLLSTVIIVEEKPTPPLSLLEIWMNYQTMCC